MEERFLLYWRPVVRRFVARVTWDRARGRVAREDLVGRSLEALWVRREHVEELRRREERAAHAYVYGIVRNCFREWWRENRDAFVREISLESSGIARCVAGSGDGMESLREALERIEPLLSPGDRAFLAAMARGERVKEWMRREGYSVGSARLARYRIARFLLPDHPLSQHLRQYAIRRACRAMIPFATPYQERVLHRIVEGATRDQMTLEFRTAWDNLYWQVKEVRRRHREVWDREFLIARQEYLSYLRGVCRDPRHEAILALLEEGYGETTVARRLGYTPHQVSQVVLMLRRRALTRAAGFMSDGAED